MDGRDSTASTGCRTAGRRWRAAAAALCLTACLPTEPEQPVTFRLDFDFPYRVFLNGDAQQPSIAVLLGADSLPGAAYELQGLDRSVVDVDESGRGVLGVARDTSSVRVAYITGTGTVDTVFPVRVVVSEVGFRPGETGAVCTPVCDNLTLDFSRLGDTTRLEAVALDARRGVVPGVEFTWLTWYPEVATVSSTGLVTVLDEGAGLVTAEADDMYAQAGIYVEQSASVVRVAPEADTLQTVGRSVRFVAAVFDSTGALLTAAKPRWWSSDTTVALVDPTGVVTATGTGIGQIVARVGTAADTATLVVDQVLRFLFVSPPLDTLIAITDTVRVEALAFDSLNFPIPNPDIVWTSSDPAIVTVDQAGLVTAQANGPALVTATSGGQSAFATMVVRQAPGRVSLVEDNVALVGTGDTARLTVEIADPNGYPIQDTDPLRLTWRTLSPLVASVDSAGLVSAFEDGVTGIIASVADTAGAPADTAIVTVTGAPPQEWIGFSSKNGVEIIAPLGGARTVLTKRDFGTPAWSPDGASLVGVAGCALFLMDLADTSHVRIVDEPPNECDANPAWSPTSTTIAFARWESCSYFGCNGASLYTVSADGSQSAKRIAADVDGVRIYNRPAWSPDGTMLAFDTYDYPTYDIYVAPAGGGVPTLIGEPSYPEVEPAWSPDGSRLAYVRALDIFVSNVDGSERVNLTGTPEVAEMAPAWSPDGTQIVFAAANRDPDPNAWQWYLDGWGYRYPGTDLYIINSDGTGLRRLTFGDDAHSPTWRRAVPLPERPGGVVAAAKGGNR